MLQFVRNTREVSFSRLSVNLIKVCGVALALMAFAYLFPRSPDSGSLFYYTCIACFGASSLTAISSASREGFDAVRGPIWLFSALYLVAVSMGLWSGYHLHWNQASSYFVIGFFFLIFMTVQGLVAFHDAEVDAFISQYHYPTLEHRSTRLLVHLTWNVLPYGICVLGAWGVARLYGVGGIVLFAFSAISVLVAFCICDEYLRHLRHWSFFWYNRPVSD